MRVRQTSRRPMRRGPTSNRGRTCSRCLAPRRNGRGHLQRHGLRLACPSLRQSRRRLMLVPAWDFVVDGSNSAHFATLLVDVPSSHHSTIYQFASDSFAWLAMAQLAAVILQAIVPGYRARCLVDRKPRLTIPKANRLKEPGSGVALVTLSVRESAVRPLPQVHT